MAKHSRTLTEKEINMLNAEIERLRGCLEEIAGCSSDPVSALAAREALDGVVGTVK